MPGSRAAAQPELNIYIPFERYDADRREVWGIATAEVLAHDGRVLDYEASKHALERWMPWGNIHEAHDLKRVCAAAVGWYPDDVKREIWVGSRLSRSADGENARIKIEEGLLKGYSLAGGIKRKESREWDEGNGIKRMVPWVTEYEIEEMSYVPRPSDPKALLGGDPPASALLVRGYGEEQILSTTLDDGRLDAPVELIERADGTHPVMTGKHAHSHPAYGSQGADKMHGHEHSHDGDANHGHGHDKVERADVSAANTPAIVKPPAEHPMGDPGATASPADEPKTGKVANLDGGPNTGHIAADSDGGDPTGTGGVGSHEISGTSVEDDNDEGKGGKKLLAEQSESVGKPAVVKGASFAEGFKASGEVMRAAAALKEKLPTLSDEVALTLAETVLRADLSGKERDSMPPAKFAYVDSKGGKHLPIHDEGHVHSALGRFAQQDFESDSKKKLAARKLLRAAKKFGIDISDSAGVAEAASVKRQVGVRSVVDICRASVMAAEGWEDELKRDDAGDEMSDAQLAQDAIKIVKKLLAREAQEFADGDEGDRQDVSELMWILDCLENFQKGEYQEAMAMRSHQADGEQLMALTRQVQEATAAAKAANERAERADKAAAEALERANKLAADTERLERGEGETSITRMHERLTFLEDTPIQRDRPARTFVGPVDKLWPGEDGNGQMEPEEALHSIDSLKRQFPRQADALDAIAAEVAIRQSHRSGGQPITRGPI